MKTRSTGGRGRSPCPLLIFLALVLAAAWSTGCGEESGSSARETPPPRAGAAVQKPGAYSYATDGSDRVETFVSARHRYPSSTTVTVARRGCTLLERWDALPERWSESRSCVSGTRWRLVSLVDYHEFFGESIEQRYDCAGRFIPRPALVRIGFRWTDRCRAPGATATIDGRVVGTQRLAVAGKPAPTVLLRLRARLRGRIRGENVIDSWLLRSTGLLVRREVRSDTVVDSSVGRVKGRERYSLRLRSLDPAAGPDD
jgi:hypothetical protein